MKKKDWTKNEIFAVDNFTCEYPEGKSFEEVMTLIEDGSEDVVIWEPFEYHAGEQVAKKKHKTEIKNGYFFSSGAHNTNETERRIPVEKYASMLVTPAFVENILNLAGLRILEFIPNGHVGRQDLFVVTHK